MRRAAACAARAARVGRAALPEPPCNRQAWSQSRRSPARQRSVSERRSRNGRRAVSAVRMICYDPSASLPSLLLTGRKKDPIVPPFC